MKLIECFLLLQGEGCNTYWQEASCRGRKERSIRRKKTESMDTKARRNQDGLKAYNEC
jgi:hypothetical protein